MWSKRDQVQYRISTCPGASRYTETHCYAQVNNNVLEKTRCILVYTILAVNCSYKIRHQYYLNVFGAL